MLVLKCCITQSVDMSMRVQIITNEEVWNDSVVRMLDCKYEADAILDIPFKCQGGGDIWYLKTTKNGSIM